MLKKKIKYYRYFKVTGAFPLFLLISYFIPFFILNYLIKLSCHLIFSAYRHWISHFNWGVVKIRIYDFLSRWPLISCPRTNSTKKLKLMIESPEYVIYFNTPLQDFTILYSPIDVIYLISHYLTITQSLLYNW